MGKRKERRLAAMSASGRRVKLDLFAEPSGDLGGSSTQDEVGGDSDSKYRAGLPNSPSSSGVSEISTRIFFTIGQQPENPLLLLGQYSDDELDEESSKGLNHAIVANSSTDPDDQVNIAAGKECEDIGKDPTAHKIEQHDMENGSALLDALQENDTRENDATDSGDLHRELDSTEQICAPPTSDIQVVGDASSGWKIVLHEESKRYYYWNTTTGETSWEVPDVLAQGTELTCEQKIAVDTEGRENAVEGAHKSSSTLDDDIAAQPSEGSKAANPNCETGEISEHRREMEVWNEGDKGDILDDKEGDRDVNQSDAKNSSGPIRALHYETSSPRDYVSSMQSGDPPLGNGSSTGAESEKYIHDIRDHGEHESGTDLSARLVKHSENLLERLKSLKGSKGNLHGHDCISKFILEVEIRLSDIKSLLSHGSFLLPFWLHSERRLKELEAAVNEDVFQFYESAHISEVEATHNSQESIGDVIKADANEKKAVCSTSEVSHASDYFGKITEVQKDLRNEAYNSCAVNTEHVSSIEYPTTHSDSGAGGKDEVHGAAILAELTPKTVLHSGEDVDMDVDMEVEDAFPASNTNIGDALGVQYPALPERPFSQDPPLEHESFASEGGFGVPPPPDEDWIPPPPPDNEPFPPPPPDEPPEPAYPPPPSDSEAVHSFSYTEQYDLSYPASNFEYYGQTNTEIPDSDLYAHAEGFQMAVPHPPLYYEAVPNTYFSAAPVVVNPIEPVAYYGIQEGAVAPVPVESSGICSESGHESLGSDQIVSVEVHAEVGCPSLPNFRVDVSAVGGETEKASVEVPSAPASVQPPGTISVTDSVPVSSTPAATAMAVATTATVPKVQSKVSRNKKRTVAVVSTLRSNKKVSSLVDKWKAAKEELHDDEEDEPENAHEILEKKRRREIQEWHAKQIASGEAKDNANFQPLGGDWRERVKRKRAQLTNEAVQTPSKGLTNQNQQPDLNELSRDLPSGWQAYWDESSKQVYYGNAVTSETTWIRPTN